MNSSNSKSVGVYMIIFWGVVSLCLFTYFYYSNDNEWLPCVCNCDHRDRSGVVSSLVNYVSTNNDSVSTATPTSNASTSTTTTETSMVDVKVSPNGSPGSLSYYKSAIFDRMDDTDKFTIVMLTYKRVKTLPPLLLHYCTTKYLSKIIVIWNDVGAEIPQNILQVNNQCAVPVVFIKETENKLTNRFKPREEIKTDCVCVIDDDRQLKNTDDLEFAFTTWQHFRMRIIGFEERTYTLQKDGSLWYGVYPGTKIYPGYSIMGTGTALFHRVYMEMYFDANFVPAEVLDYINTRMNCEDIWFNVVVSKFLGEVSWKQPGALVINPIGVIENLAGKAYYTGGTRGLSTRKTHYDERTECLNKFATFFNGSIPLHYTKLRIMRRTNE